MMKQLRLYDLGIGKSMKNGDEGCDSSEDDRDSSTWEMMEHGNRNWSDKHVPYGK